MAPRPPTRLLVLGSLAAAVVVALSAVVVTARPPRAEPPAVARMLKPTVTVRHRRPAPFLVFSRPVPLRDGSTIRTAAVGSAQIDYPGGAFARLGPTTEYSVSALQRRRRPMQFVGTLAVGRSWHAVVNTGRPRDGWLVEMPHGAAAVGRSFAIACLVRTACDVTVVEGDLRLLDLATGRRLRDGTGQPVAMGAGQSATVTSTATADGTPALVVGALRAADPNDRFVAEHGFPETTGRDR